MKVGQVLSTVDFTAIPESEREEFKATLAALRDDVPPLPFKKVRKLLEEELGGKVDDHFDSFEEEAFAAASIGQVHRAVTARRRRGGGQAPVPGRRRGGRVRPAQPVAAAAGQAARARARRQGALRRAARAHRRGLDYEIEAQNHRAVERAFRDHPFIHVPKVHTGLSSRRVLVTDLLHGERFAEVKRLDEAERDRFAEIVFRFYFSLLCGRPRVCGDPHPGNYLLLDDGRVGFLDFGLMRPLDAEHLEGERALARAIVAEDAPEASTRSSPASATSPTRRLRAPRRCSSGCWPPASGTSSPASAA